MANRKPPVTGFIGTSIHDWFSQVWTPDVEEAFPYYERIPTRLADEFPLYKSEPDNLVSFQSC